MFCNEKIGLTQRSILDAEVKKVRYLVIEISSIKQDQEGHDGPQGQGADNANQDNS